jgi:hypothetical protein
LVILFGKSNSLGGLIIGLPTASMVGLPVEANLRVLTIQIWILARVLPVAGSVATIPTSMTFISPCA